MAVTRLQRKDQKNKYRANMRQATIKRLNAKPVIKNVDIEEIKASFAKKSKPSKKAVKEEQEQTAEASE